MKRLERLGSAAFVTISISLVFHILAMSYDRFINNQCLNCNSNQILSTWYTSLTQRCYLAPVTALFSLYNYTLPSGDTNIRTTSICIENKFLEIKNPEYASYCLNTALAHPHTVCALGTYNPDYCKCDYTSRTKAVLAMAILAALALGIMVILSHVISFVKIDYILRWLIPLCFALLSFSILCIIIVLSVAGSDISEGANELFYSVSLLRATLKNETLVNQEIASMKNQTDHQYKISIGWCFGMEILALHFSVVTLVLYALMFTAKKRPEPQATK